jgi:putative DNA primase/helicase
MTRDHLEAFAAAIVDAGLGRPAEMVADGQLRRFHVSDDRRGTLNGWYWLRVDGEEAFGGFGSWKTGVKLSWTAGTKKQLSTAERREARERERAERERREKERLDRWAAVADRARRLWSAAEPVLFHEYLRRKAVLPFGTRVLRDLLVVPLRTTDGRLWSLQFIAPAGAKRFLRGGRKRGCYFPLTSRAALPGKLYVAEGLATGATLHMATRHPVAVAFDAGNLRPVAETLRVKHPELALVVAADNDAATPGNPGLSSAIAAARAVRGTYILPSFGD